MDVTSVAISFVVFLVLVFGAAAICIPRGIDDFRPLCILIGVILVGIVSAAIYCFTVIGVEKDADTPDKEAMVRPDIIRCEERRIS